MKLIVLSLSVLAARQVAAHSTFQQLWVEGVDYQGTCARTPNSNSPIETITSPNMRCNANSGSKAMKCPVAAGGTVTVEMHAQAGDRSCANEAIGGQHYGPVIVYLSKVTDSSTADGSGGWFKIFQDGWSKVAGTSRGDDDNWGVKDLNKCCGRMNVKIPADIPAGDYLLRAEVIALHAARAGGGAQFYMTCYQLTVSGGGSASPPTVSFPGAYSWSDPGLGSIHGTLNEYIVPGGPVYSGGSTKSAGAGCSGVETGKTPGPFPGTSVRPTTTAGPVPTTSPAGPAPTTRTTTGFVTTTTRPTTTSVVVTPGGCSVQKYGQCGGTGFTGCTSCAAPAVCSAVSPPYYSQCL